LIDAAAASLDAAPQPAQPPVQSADANGADAVFQDVLGSVQVALLQLLLHPPMPALLCDLPSCQVLGKSLLNFALN
jgi:hypothetical protein